MVVLSGSLLVSDITKQLGALEKMRIKLGVGVNATKQVKQLVLFTG